MFLDNATSLRRRTLSSRVDRANPRLKRALIVTFFAVGLAVFLGSFAFAFDFPPLTGRVVDQANVMTAQSRSDIESKLKALEDNSGIQLVVATVKSLQGSDIESYANELFRFWKIGQAQKNNGVLDERFEKFSGLVVFRENFFERKRLRAERFSQSRAPLLA